jgi:hypothetical protein
MTPQGRQEPRAAGLLTFGYEVEVEGVDSLGADGADSPLPEAVLDELLAAGLRPWKPQALPFG